MLEVKQRQKTTIELSLFMMRSFVFVKMLNCSKQHIHCGNARSLVISVK